MALNSRLKLDPDFLLSCRYNKTVSSIQIKTSPKDNSEYPRTGLGPRN